MTAVLPDPAVEPTIKAARVAAILGISERGVYAAAERGEIPSIRVDRTVRFPTALLLARYGLGETKAVAELAKMRAEVSAMRAEVSAALVEAAEVLAKLGRRLSNAP